MSQEDTIRIFLENGANLEHANNISCGMIGSRRCENMKFIKEWTETLDIKEPDC